MWSLRAATSRWICETKDYHSVNKRTTLRWCSVQTPFCVTLIDRVKILGSFPVLTFLSAVEVVLVPSNFSTGVGTDVRIILQASIRRIRPLFTISTYTTTLHLGAARSYNTHISGCEFQRLFIRETGGTSPNRSQQSHLSSVQKKQNSRMSWSCLVSLSSQFILKL